MLIKYAGLIFPDVFPKKPTRGTKTAHQTSGRPAGALAADRSPRLASVRGGEPFVLELLPADAGLGHQPALHVREHRDTVPELGDGGRALIQRDGACLRRQVDLALLELRQRARHLEEDDLGELLAANLGPDRHLIQRHLPGGDAVLEQHAGSMSTADDVTALADAGEDDVPGRAPEEVAHTRVDPAVGRNGLTRLGHELVVRG